MNEQIEVLNRNGFRLRGNVHTPEKEASNDSPIVFMIPGLDGTKVGPHQMLRKISIVLEQRGIVSYRFDLTGQGESDGDFSQINRETHLSDLEDIFRIVKALDRKVIMVGFSMGGITAAMSADRLPNVTGVVMLSPTFNIADLAAQYLKNTPPEQKIVNYLGNIATRTQVESLARIQVREELAKVHCPSLLISGGSDRLVPQESFTDYHQNVLGSACAHYRIPKANHQFSGVDWEQQVLRLVSDFVCSIGVLV